MNVAKEFLRIQPYGMTFLTIRDSRAAEALPGLWAR
jgi:hypothetical protein